MIAKGNKLKRRIYLVQYFNATLLTTTTETKRCKTQVWREWSETLYLAWLEQGLIKVQGLILYEYGWSNTNKTEM